MLRPAQHSKAGGRNCIEQKQDALLSTQAQSHEDNTSRAGPPHQNEHKERAHAAEKQG
jgi:hypothetical protein